MYMGGREEPAALLFSLLLSLPMVSRSRMCGENENKHCSGKQGLR